MNRKKNNKTSKSTINQKTIIIAGAIFAVITLFTLFSKKDTSETRIKDTQTVAGGDLTIIKSDVTEEAKFYGYQSNDTYMEVLAVRAADGTVRTALNTCQTCNNSGKGYYVQEGNVLVCQNCGNQFTIDQIELVKNGCNPVPIEQNIKTEDEEKIVVQGDALAQYESLFTVWKS
ncbi:MAG: hypothetical protein K0R69_2153 [Clostridia bacterium]|jgi:uncharacterized membrane protein|nr:hypothetical protein [Clostridia bacterium]